MKNDERSKINIARISKTHLMLNHSKETEQTSIVVFNNNFKEGDCHGK